MRTDLLEMADQACKRPRSTNVREVRITETLAAWHDALMLGAPAVKLIIAGTRPIACSAKNVTATPTEFGSITPTAPPGAANGASLGPSTCAARISLR